MSRPGHAAQVWLHVDDDKAEEQDLVCKRIFEEFNNTGSDCFKIAEKLAKQTVSSTQEASCPVMMSNMKTTLMAGAAPPENPGTARPGWLFKNSGVYRLFHGFLTGKKSPEINNEHNYWIVPPSVLDPPKR